MCTCKRHILPRNVSNKRSASRIDPMSFFVLNLINNLPMCRILPSVQRDLFADDGTFNTANNNIDNIRRGLHKV